MLQESIQESTAISLDQDISVSVEPDQKTILENTLKSIMDTAGHQHAEAIRLLEEAGKQDPQLYQAIIGEHLYHDRCVAKVGQWLRNLRFRILHNREREQAIVRANAERVHYMARANMAALLDMPLPFLGGVLGDATKEQLMEAAKLCLEKAQRYSAQSRFYTFVAESLPPGGKVRAEFSEKALSKIYQKVTQEQEAA